MDMKDNSIALAPDSAQAVLSSGVQIDFPVGKPSHNTEMFYFLDLSRHCLFL